MAGTPHARMRRGGNFQPRPLAPSVRTTVMPDVGEAEGVEEEAAPVMLVAAPFLYVSVYSC